jgi:hypothetical protein
LDGAGSRTLIARMQRQPRLSRTQVMARLRAHAARLGEVSVGALDEQDRLVLHSLRLYFPSFEAACRAANVAVAKPRRGERGTIRMPNVVWSQGRVVEELQGLDGEGQSTTWGDLIEAGRGDLIGAAATYAGGLQEARAQAGVARARRRLPVPRWNQDSIVSAIRDRVRSQQTLASSKAPPHFVAAARWHFGSWEQALAAAGVDAEEVRMQRPPYTREEIVALIQRLAQDGAVVRAATLKGEVKLDTVRKLFGSVEAAIQAAGITPVETHPSQKWSRERVIEELRTRAQQGEVTLTRALHHAVQRYFGGVYAARAAAGLPALQRTAWTTDGLIAELRRRERRGKPSSRLWAACKRLFGSVEAARAAAGLSGEHDEGMAGWNREALIAELRRRTRGRRQLGRGLTEGLRRQFGSLEAARAAAGVMTRREAAARAAAPGTGPAVNAGSRGTPVLRGARWRRWSREEVLEKLAAWSAAGGRLRGDLQLACKHHFGSVAHAAAAAGLERVAIRWTPARIRKALHEPGFDVADPAFVAACIDHFGSVTAARAAAAQHQRVWSKATVIAELQARARRGLKGVGRLLRQPAVRLFGSTEAALEAAAHASPRRPGRQVSPGSGARMDDGTLR